jgi:RNA polymerase sigma-70 factor (ECF subfamily)
MLKALDDPSNQMVWVSFDARYRPLVFALARKLGLQDEDAADVAQQTLAEFLRAYRAGQYDRTRGRLSSWIISIARNQVSDVHRARKRRRERRGQSAFANIPADEELERVWEAEQQRVIRDLAWQELRASPRMHEKTLRAFELFTLLELPVERVSTECGMSADEVYRVKYRVTNRLREIVKRLTAAYAEEA